MIAPHLLPKHPPKPVQIDPAFVFADGVAQWEIEAAKPRQRSEAEHRLVKAAKSPTEVFSKKKGEFRARQDDAASRDHSTWCPEIIEFDGDDRPVKVERGTAGVYAVIQYREWSEEWRIRSRVETISGTKPPEQSGTRESFMLTDRAARKIAESCEYMAAKHGGYSTFLTATFSDESREKIASGEVTIQREVSRLMDGLNKMYRRGWNTETGEKVPAETGQIPYCWVVEIPQNDNGEDNPHVHILMKWRVPYRQFKCWANRIEKIWGHGFAHLEKIKDPECAGAYMAKAADRKSVV